MDYTDFSCPSSCCTLGLVTEARLTYFLGLVMTSGKFLPCSSNQSLGPQDVTATNRQWKKWMTQKHSRVLKFSTSTYDFEGVHKVMEDPMGLKEKRLNLQ